jgi:hypothetical protein
MRTETGRGEKGAGAAVAPLCAECGRPVGGAAGLPGNEVIVHVQCASAYFMRALRREGVGPDRAEGTDPE